MVKTLQEASSAAPSSAGNPSRRSAIHPLAQQGQPYKIAHIRLGLTGQIAAVESGLAMAALTPCSTPEHLQVLGAAHGLDPLEPMQVVVYRSRASQGSKAVDILQHVGADPGPRGLIAARACVCARGRRHAGATVAA